MIPQPERVCTRGKSPGKCSRCHRDGEANRVIVECPPERKRRGLRRGRCTAARSCLMPCSDIACPSDRKSHSALSFALRSRHTLSWAQISIYMGARG